MLAKIHDKNFIRAAFFTDSCAAVDSASIKDFLCGPFLRFTEFYSTFTKSIGDIYCSSNGQACNFAS